MSTTLYPIKGTISYNKTSGVVQSNGLVPPDSGMDSLGVGDSVQLVFRSAVKSANGGITINKIIASPTLKLYDWRCTPTGWIYGATNDIQENLLGEYVSTFKCLSEYKSLVLNLDIEEILDTLTMYNSSKVRITNTPYASLTDNSWWKLSDITNWTLPALADGCVASLSLTEYTSDVQVIRSLVPLVDQLFFMDAFTQTVSLINKFPVVTTGTSGLSVSSYLDLRTVSEVDLIGGKGDPLLDPRTDSTDKLVFELIQTDDGISSSISLVEKFSGSVWLNISNSSIKKHVNKIFSLLIKPVEVPKTFQTYMEKVFLKKEEAKTYSRVALECYKVSGLYYTAYMASKQELTRKSYNFNVCAQGINPYAHVSPLITDTVSIEVEVENEILNLLDQHIDTQTQITLKSLGFNLPSVNIWGTNNNINETTEEEFDYGNYKAIKVSHTYHDTTIYCSSQTSDESSIPYLFYRPNRITFNYQAGLFLLNLNSLFWVTPHAETDLGAVDPNGVRVWLGYFDAPDNFGMMATGIVALKNLMEEGTDPKVICVFVKDQYLMKESDIMVAAICDELSEESPQAYSRGYDIYYKSAKQWADGHLRNLSGLNYSYRNAHPGLAETIALLAEKHGEKTIEKILERVLPGTKIADVKDAASNSYCLDMLKWIEDYGLYRISGHAEPEPLTPEEEAKKKKPAVPLGSKTNIRVPPLLESVNTVRYHNGIMQTKHENRLTGDIDTTEVPTQNRQEWVYLAPRYSQLSTIERTPDPVSTKVISTKVMDWDQLYTLKTLYQNKLLGKNIVVANYDIDFSDNHGGAKSEITSCMSDISVRNIRLTVSGEGLISVGYSQLSELK